MGFRFRKSFKVAPGVKLNIGKKGVSTTIGTKGAKITVGSNGTRATVGIPGTGISYTTKLSNKKQTANNADETPTDNKIAKKLNEFGDIHTAAAENAINNITQDKFYKKDWFILLMYILFYPLGLFLVYKCSIRLRKFRFAFYVIPLIVISIVNNTLAGVLGLFLPMIFVPIFLIGFLYCLLKKRYFMPWGAGIIISCLSILVFGFTHIG